MWHIIQQSSSPCCPYKVNCVDESSNGKECSCDNFLLVCYYFFLFSGYSILANQMLLAYILYCTILWKDCVVSLVFPYFQFCGAHDAVDSNPHRSMNSSNLNEIWNAACNTSQQHFTHSNTNISSLHYLLRLLFSYLNFKFFKISSIVDFSFDCWWHMPF